MMPYTVVDAFTDEPFQGNPAAVVMDGDELSDEAMQRIAREFNLSETVFILRPTARPATPAVRLRWFTPSCEVSFCGHATLAAIHSFCRRERIEASEIAVECAAGNLTVTVEPGPDSQRFWLAMPRPELQPARVPPGELLGALRVPPGAKVVGELVRTRDEDVIVLLGDGRLVRTLEPDIALLDRVSRAHKIRGVSVASTDSGSPDVACISRFFAPAAGIAEDPVTGSVHGPLAALLIRDGRVLATAPGVWKFKCGQLPAVGRVGSVFVRATTRADTIAIEVGGSCVTVMNGVVAT